jgi:hypothetical protein
MSGEGVGEQHLQLSLRPSLGAVAVVRQIAQEFGVLGRLPLRAAGPAALMK